MVLINCSIWKFETRNTSPRSDQECNLPGTCCDSDGGGNSIGTMNGIEIERSAIPLILIRKWDHLALNHASRDSLGRSNGLTQPLTLYSTMDRKKNEKRR